MKNIAVIFAGGSGKRMNTVSRPKQFLELNGKPVIIYTGGTPHLFCHRGARHGRGRRALLPAFPRRGAAAVQGRVSGHPLARGYPALYRDPHRAVRCVL